MKRLLIATCALLGVAAAQNPANSVGLSPVHKWPMIKYKGCMDYTKIHSQEEFYQCEDKYLDGLIAQWKGQVKPGARLILSGNAQFLHGRGIARYSTETLIAFVREVAKSGAGRIDINPSTITWVKPIPESIAKYDAAIAEIRRLGMQISFNPTTFPGFDPPAKYADWQKISAKMFAELARRYKPEVFSVMHEPWSMDHRLGAHVTPEQWRGFIADSVRIVKEQSPSTKCVASFLPHEVDVLEAALKVKSLDGIGLDIYQEYDDFKTFDRMIKMAHDAGKFAYIAETGRPMITFRSGSLDFDPVASVADPQLGKLDPKWMQAMCLYAASRGLEAMTEFWTATFFSYSSPNGDPLTPQFNANVEKAMLAGEHTVAFTAFQELSKKYQAKR